MTTKTSFTHYELTERREEFEEGEVTEYSIAAFDEAGEQIYRLDGVTQDKQALSELVEACNRGRLSSVHIKDVLSDFVEMRS